MFRHDTSWLVLAWFLAWSLAALPILPSPNLKRDDNFRMTLLASRTVVKIAQVEKFLAAG